LGKDVSLGHWGEGGAEGSLEETLGSGERGLAIELAE